MITRQEYDNLKSGGYPYEGCLCDSCNQAREYAVSLVGKYEEQTGRVTKSNIDTEDMMRGMGLREYTSAERKAMPVVTGVDHYFPDAKAAKARVSKKGNDKHNPGEPLHWSRDKSQDHLDCAGRHLLTPFNIDPDSGELELAHAAWRIDAALQEAEEKRLLALGIKPLSGVTK